ncbi:RNA helicase aquarius-like [Branchiostoma lanceolatum]|uniref:RNA helicase aquarius-like n=1 Tax=Branchiostoma lanceolatum TaxID=7740 RepID=UPI003455D9C6
MSGRGRKGAAITVEQIQGDRLTQFANKLWAPHRRGPTPTFDPQVVEDIYKKDLLGTKFAIRRVMLLEFSQFLENFLWPNYNPDKATHAHMMSVAVMVNEKFREKVPAWEPFVKKPDHFPMFFRRVMAASLQEEGITLREQTVLLVFLIHCFNSLEVDLVRGQVQRLVSLPMWINLLPARLQQELKATPKLKKFWNVLKKADSRLNPPALERSVYDRQFLYQLMKKFFGTLDSIPATGPVEMDKVHYCERFMELMIDLEALLPTRRWFNTLMDDSHLVVKCRLSKLTKKEEGRLFNQLLDRLTFYAGFEINDQTGEALTDHNMTDLHYNSITSLQRAVFKHFEELQKFAFANVASIDTREALQSHFSAMSARKLHEVCAYLNLLPHPEGDGESSPYSTKLLLELLVSRHERRLSQLEALNEMPLYPTEEILWDENIVPTEYFSGEGCLALPKLNLQFLTLHDYLLRNFNLFRLESTYEIRQDVEDAVGRMKPWKAEDGSVYFGGWARMAQPVVAFAVVEVSKPHVGKNHPSRVRADVTVNLNLRQHIKQEWESLRKHDVCFLVSVRPTLPIGTRYSHDQPFVPQVGLTCVRGCEIEGMLDEKGRVIEEGPDPKPNMPGENRTFRVWLDPNQYQGDMARTMDGAEDVYETFNIIMRRKPKENNFKAVLETIRDLMNTECVVPDWLHDVLLGYGDPSSAHYTKMDNQIAELDFCDTFLSMDHLKACFPEYQVKVTTEDPSKQLPPFKVSFPEVTDKKRKREDESGEAMSTDEESKHIVVEPYTIPNRGPYPYNQPKKNTVPFTSTQVEAIRAGMQPGLTMVVGPPGTGKTDVAVQIISNIYHNFPEQRTLIVTHSNQALNQLFEKIMALDIDERHLLRLGHGEEALETEKDFSRYGRVNFVLARRLELLKEVARLQESLGVPGDVAYTCETAGHFYLYQVLARWEEYLSKVKRPGLSVEVIKEHFPFEKYFANAPQPIFKGKSYDEDMDIAEGCFRHIKKMFKELEEFRAFELLRSGLDRSKYLLVKEAKVIAMTCTHAALKRHDLVEVGFKYDNILMEEAAQILEIETFIPLLLQNPEDGFSRLKRWIMIGDHHQLPPVIKNMAFQKFSNMEQSLFTRFIRLGVPPVDLDAQGRARPSICDLYNWRYKKLGNLPHVQHWEEYRQGNAGFCFDYQLINVEDFNGVGESEPNPYFYQNLAEAEYVVGIFMYMRLLGYPAEKISILTTYNGQKHLIRDVINQRCGDNALIGRPSKVTTVDRFQGQQNDYILLSLVRTKAVGHLRDVRRLVVAMSRARLGLYVVARVSLFQNCYELTPAFNLLMERPLKLHLIPHETHPTLRKNGDPPNGATVGIQDMPHMAQFVYDMYNSQVHHMQETMRAEQRMQRRFRELRPPVKPKPSQKPAAGKEEEKEEKMEEEREHVKMPEHPGRDSDSEGEQEEEEGDSEEKKKGDETTEGGAEGEGGKEGDIVDKKSEEDDKKSEEKVKKN